jgi:hypothetical protein
VLKTTFFWVWEVEFDAPVVTQKSARNMFFSTPDKAASRTAYLALSETLP